MDEGPGCDECHATAFEWMDDDGVLRCETCHTNVATAWGGEYDILTQSRNGAQK